MTVDIAAVEVRHPLIIVEELAYPILIGMNVLRPHEAITVTGASEIVRLHLESCLVCIEEHTSVKTQQEVVGAVASILTDTTLPPHAASRVKVCLPPKVLNDSNFFTEPLPHELATTASAVCPSVCNHRCHSRVVRSELVGQALKYLRRRPNRHRVLSDAETIVVVV